MKRNQRSPRRTTLCFDALEDRTVPSTLPVAAPLAQPDAATQAHASAAYGQLPLSFEANQGQTDTSVNFLSRGSGYTLFLTPNEAVLSLKQAASEDVLRMQLVGANPTARVAGLDQQSGTSNYLLGNDPSQWHTDIANYGRVEYRDVYAGIDIVYYGNQRQLEYDFIVAPGADPTSIRLAFQGAERMSLDAQGNFVLHTSGGDVVEHAPVVYQEVAGVRRAVAGRYVLQGSGQVGFALGAYDVSQPLTIDPILSYSTYLGGSGSDYGYGIAVDGADNAYVTGTTNSTNFPTKNPLQPSIAGSQDVFVTKLNAAGSALVYSTYLGGSNQDVGKSIALFTDTTGPSPKTFAYVTGYTASTNFPTLSPLQANLGGGTDAFVAKLNETGTGLVYSTYLGGSGQDKGEGIAVDGAGNAYVTGSTPSTNFPTANALQPTLGGGYDGFVAELNPTGSAFVYSTYLGGSSNDSARAIAVDGSGNAYVTGQTGSTNFGTTVGALQTTRRGFTDAFITKLSVGGTGLGYSTYLGGSDGGKGTGDIGTGIAVFTDTFGNTFAYVTGATESTDFPTTRGAMQTVNAGGISDAFVAKLNTAGSALVYSTYLGGSGDDNYIGLMGAIAVDSAGNAYVTGETRSANFPVVNALQPTYAGGGADAFVAEFNAAGSVVYSTYLGGNVGSVGAGSGGDTGNGIAVDSGGNAYVIGTTESRDFPTKNALQATFGAGRKSHTSDAFVTKIGPSAALMAASSSSAMDKATATPLTAPQVQPLLDEAIQRWLRTGADVSSLRGATVQFADLPGATLGQASGHTITLDSNAAGWGWFVDPTPRNDSEFTTRGNQGEQHRMDLLTVLEHEIGHLLGHDHDEGGVMSETLSAGGRWTLGGVYVGDPGVFLAPSPAAEDAFPDPVTGRHKR